MNIYLRSQSAYIPTDPHAKPACAFLPALLRRRCSMATRMALEASHASLQQCGLDPRSVSIVHCSRFGEIQALHELLQSLVHKEPLSPTTFSNSVHHTPIGYFSLYSHNQGIARTLSAGESTFAMGLLEAYAMACKSTTPVLMVYSDEFVPTPFQSRRLNSAPVGAWAFLFSQSAEHALAQCNLDTHTAIPCSTGTPIDFMQWLESSNNLYSLGVGGGALQWSR